MAISRAQLAKELEPGLAALFGMEYDRYDQEHAEIFETESSDRAFEEEVMLTGFATAPTKAEGSSLTFDTATEAYTARYSHETIALAFALTEEAMEDNLYDRLGARYTRALARSMSNTKQVKASNVLNNGFTVAGGDGVSLLNTAHPLAFGGTFANRPTTDADAPNGFKNYQRSPLRTSMEGDFTTGNVRFKARERYSFGYSDPRCVFGTTGA